MIDLAVIASVAHLADLSARGSIDMALTHLVLANPDYAAHYRDRAATGVRVLLDNSAYELEASTGVGMHATAVLDAATRINAAVVVCTDALYDGPATVAATRRFLTAAADSRYQFMAVPQGTTRAEWLDCYFRLTDLGVDLIGLSKLSVPRCFAAPVAEARLDCADILHRRDEAVPLHLLGGDRSLPWELAEHRRRSHDLITGNDSSFAYWYPATGIAVHEATGRARPRRARQTGPHRPPAAHQPTRHRPPAHRTAAPRRRPRPARRPSRRREHRGEEPTMGMTSHVHLVTQVEGLHHWPDAEHPEQYLRAPHRHLFVVTAQIQVFTHDREIEINAATRWMSGVLAGFAHAPAEPDAPLDFGPQSCERLAARLVDALTDRYGRHRRIRCTATEDGLLGAGATWEPTPATASEPRA